MPRNDDPFDNYDEDEDDGFLTFDAREEESASRGPIILGAIVLLLVVFGAIAWAYFVGNKGSDETPQIAAQTDTFKEAPMEPGGLGTEDLDKGVYDSASGAAPPPLEVEAAGASTGAEDPLVAANVVAPPPVQPAPIVKTAPPPRPATTTATPKPKPATTTATTAPKPKPVVKAQAPTPTKAAPKPETKSEPAPVSASATPKDNPSSTSGSYSAQLGSYATRAAADTAAAQFRQQTSGNVAISAADLGAKGTWYRVRVTGLDSREAAVAFCAKVKAGGGNCIPSR